MIRRSTIGDSEFRPEVSGFSFRISDFSFRISDFGFRPEVSGLGSGLKLSCRLFMYLAGEVKFNVGVVVSFCV